MKKQLLAMAVIAAATGTAQAEQFWADNSVSALYGSDYKVDGPKFDDGNSLTTYTLEHVSGHSWGGLFYFMDRHVGDDGFTATYSEFSPKVTLASFEGGLVKSVNAAFTLESSSGGFDNYLYGVGADLAIPGMNFASATVFYAVNDNSANDYQLTLTYGWSAGAFNIDGYIDYSTQVEADGNRFGSKANLHFNPQITYDLAPVIGKTFSKVKVGIEYSYWGNKYGIEGIDQNAVSALLKVHL
ncbi:MAG: hypothetical protein LRY66_14170 [Saccharospirillaceae bacterium]|nr:hypothetical protein [Saccharospirillaceae bacterium]MCD8532453.1 hypothetical protein [Saccharospirillaceae bacterium]